MVSSVIIGMSGTFFHSIYLSFLINLNTNIYKLMNQLRKIIHYTFIYFLFIFLLAGGNTYIHTYIHMYHKVLSVT